MQFNRLLSLEKKFSSPAKRKLATAKEVTFPSPQTIFNKYPPALDENGDRISYGGYANECSVRLSMALQKSEITVADLRGSDRFRPTEVISDGGWVVQPSAAALADWLEGRLKYPQKMTHATGEWQKSDFAGKSGIIYFAHSHRGGTGPGHIDVLLNGETGSGFYPNKVVWFWEYANGSWFADSAARSLGMSNLSRQMNPGLFGIAGLEAVEAITLGLTAAQTLSSAVHQNGKLTYQPVKASRTMKKEPNPYSIVTTRKIFGAVIGTPIGASAEVVFELKVQSNEFGEMVALVQHSLSQSTSFEYSSLNATFTNLGMNPMVGGEKDPRAWPIRFAYQGQFDPWGNGKFDFQGEFEFNAFGYFKILRHEVVSRSLLDATIGGSPDDHVFRYADALNYTIPALPPAQRRLLMENYRNDPNYTGN